LQYQVVVFPDAGTKISPNAVDVVKCRCFAVFQAQVAVLPTYRSAGRMTTLFDHHS